MTKAEILNSIQFRLCQQPFLKHVVVPRDWLEKLIAIDRAEVKKQVREEMSRIAKLEQAEALKLRSRV